tara:strand:+ start:1508 stop:1690 length:183 start_codon:yes stop_codon:yes gene_type:complete
MPWIPDNLEEGLPHQGKRRDKPIVPKQQAPSQDDTKPCMLPTIRVGLKTISMREEPDNRR